MRASCAGDRVAYRGRAARGVHGRRLRDEKGEENPRLVVITADNQRPEALRRIPRFPLPYPSRSGEGQNIFQFLVVGKLSFVHTEIKVLFISGYPEEPIILPAIHDPGKRFLSQAFPSLLPSPKPAGTRHWRGARSRGPAGLATGQIGLPSLTWGRKKISMLSISLVE